MLVPNEADWESNQRSADVAVDQVVPILEAKGKLVDSVVREDAIHGEVCQLKVIDGEVSVGQIAGAVGLIVQAVVGLRGIADVGGVPVVDRPVHAAVVAPFVKGTRDGNGRLRGKPGALGKHELVVRR